MICPWSISKKSLKRLSAGKIAARRNQWSMVTKALAIEVFNDAISTFNSTLPMMIGTPYGNYSNGILSKNFDYISLEDSTILPENISFRCIVNGEERGYAIAKEQGGAISFAQSESGLIVVHFYRAEVKLPNPNALTPHITTTVPNVESMYLKTPIPRQSTAILFGVYEPKKLTKRCIRKIVDRGISFLIETRNNARQSWRTRWLFLKQTEMYKGIIIGVISSTLVSLAIEAGKGLIQLATTTPPAP